MNRPLSPPAIIGPWARRAMTMLELLTVISIVSVLAAIAVPNFLEAQVRSKVARAHMDMAAVALAMKSYRADHGRYPPNSKAVQDALLTLSALPPGQTTATAITGNTPRASDADYQTALTTPLAYLSGITLDVFYSESTYGNGGYRNRYLSLGVYDLSGIPQEPLEASYGFRPGFLIVSNGPASALPNWNPANGSVTVYDPTNGTVSRGPLLMLNTQLAQQRPGMLPADLPLPSRQNSGNGFGFMMGQ